MRAHLTEQASGREIVNHRARMIQELSVPALTGCSLAEGLSRLGHHVIAGIAAEDLYALPCALLI
jgi:hypothetical protein